MTEGLGSAEDWYLQGQRHLSSGAVSEAEACFREAIRLSPGLAEAHTNLALLLEQRGEVAETEHHHLQAINLNPTSFKAHLNLGALLAGQKRFEEAELAYRRAIELEPNAPAAWTNLGVLQACRKQEAEAELSYRKAITLDPEYRPAYFNVSYLLLRQGRFEEGWECLEAREWYAQLERMITCPRWQGEALEGRSLLIGFEGGHGDMIQFCRYTSALKGLGAARITLLCHPALKTLFETLEPSMPSFTSTSPFPFPTWTSGRLLSAFLAFAGPDSIPFLQKYRISGPAPRSWRGGLPCCHRNAPRRIFASGSSGKGILFFITMQTALFL